VDIKREEDEHSTRRTSTLGLTIWSVHNVVISCGTYPSIHTYVNSMHKSVYTYVVPHILHYILIKLNYLSLLVIGHVTTTITTKLLVPNKLG
jgi:hypothetical protein